MQNKARALQGQVHPREHRIREPLPTPRDPLGLFPSSHRRRARHFQAARLSHVLSTRTHFLASDVLYVVFPLFLSARSPLQRRNRPFTDAPLRSTQNLCTKYIQSKCAQRQGIPIQLQIRTEWLAERNGRGRRTTTKKKWFGPYICGILATHMPACPRQSQGERVSLETVE